MKWFDKRFKENDEDAKLPANRRQLFADVCKNDFALLTDVSLLCFVFSLPLFALFVVGYVALTSPGAPPTAALSVVFYVALASVPAFALRYAAKGACFGVMKKRVHNEGFLIGRQFRECFKQSGKCAVCGVFVGLSFFFCAVGSLWLPTLTDDAFIKGLGIGVCLLQFALTEGTAQYFCAENCFYVLSFFDMVKNGFSFAVMKFHATLLYFIVAIAAPFVLCALHFAAALAVTAVGALFADGFFMLVCTLYSHAVFDRYINAFSYPEMVDKGLYKGQ